MDHLRERARNLAGPALATRTAAIFHREVMRMDPQREYSLEAAAALKEAALKAGLTSFSFGFVRAGAAELSVGHAE